MAEVFDIHQPAVLEDQQLHEPKNGSYPPTKATGGPVGRRVCPVILSLM